MTWVTQRISKTFKSLITHNCHKTWLDKNWRYNIESIFNIAYCDKLICLIKQKPVKNSETNLNQRILF